MSFESIVSRIQALPPLPESVRRLEEAFQKGEPDMKMIVSIIEADPLLTTSILAKANAPINGMKQRIVSVMQAVTLFGLGTVRAFALKVSMERNFDIDMSPYGIGNEILSKIGTLQNALMFQWYMGINIEKAKILIPLAFLMETGKVIIAKEVVESSYGELFREELSKNDSVKEVEEEFAGITSAAVGAMLFRHWNFDALFIQLMEHLDEKGEIPVELKEMVMALNAVRAAVNVKAQLSDESIDEGSRIVIKMGQESSRFVKTARRVREKYIT